MNLPLHGKVAVVTGGGEGIGLASAQLLAEAGASVFIIGRRQATLDAAVATIGPNTTSIAADVSKPSDSTVPMKLCALPMAGSISW